MSRGVLSTDFIGFLGITGMLTLFLYKLGEKASHLEYVYRRGAF